MKDKELRKAIQQLEKDGIVDKQLRMVVKKLLNYFGLAAGLHSEWGTDEKDIYDLPKYIQTQRIGTPKGIVQQFYEIQKKVSYLENYLGVYFRDSLVGYGEHPWIPQKKIKKRKK